MKTIAIIPARGGSQRILGKNKKLFHGKPIIVYSIEKAFESRLFDDVIVSTDDDEIANIARNAGASVYFRDLAFCYDEVGTQAVVGHCLRGLYGSDGYLYEVCCIYATSPLMDTADLIRGYYQFRALGGYVFSVGYSPLEDAGQFYWGKAISFVADDHLIDCCRGLIRIAPNRVCDINTLNDWYRAERMYEELQK